jgi:enamine deaminase RidA (YjgF/YER057c/UK114 family)
MQFLQPPGWPRPKGYSNGIVADGKMVFVAGQVGWDETETFASDDFIAQVRQALTNVVAVLQTADAGPEHIVRMTWYIADAKEYNARLDEMGAVYRDIIGKNFPVMAMVQVAGFVEEGAKIEVEATAVLPR